MPYFILVVLIGIVIAIQIILRMRARNDKGNIQSFIYDEQQANFSKKHEIPGKMFFTPDISRLPIRDYPNTEKFKTVARRQELVINDSKKRMINSSQNITNRDLKSSYGAVNLDIFTAGEENFMSYIHRLNSWAEELISLHSLDDAETVLLESIKSHSDVSKSYTLLADVYAERKKTEELLELQRIVENSELALRSKILGHIIETRARLKT